MPAVKPPFRLPRIPLARATPFLLRSLPQRTPFVATPRTFSTTPVPRLSRTTPKMGGKIQEIKTADEWQTLVIDSKDPIVVDFHATWCGPCKAIAPAVEKLSEANPNVKFYKVDVDELQEVAANNGVSAMPTFLFFKDGEKLADKTVRGANPPAINAAVQALAA
ncbi:thioredoxin [Penicillium chermesinum]|uniref:Thioredoxin n=1 Tax=Penicillium chermesinum TaxID=63820 RepID=A0A9W9PHL8_9EURO|nr:thioredoxin [Penicillium chermesinum]KAJ5246317.1 thioredoxin [Penicillium chermesinum]KAJ6144603.1 thioredoxin [Penicillium chermesinum]